MAACLAYRLTAVPCNWLEIGAPEIAGKADGLKPAGLARKQEGFGTWLRKHPAALSEIATTSAELRAVLVG
jgi:hypothetical protein